MLKGIPKIISPELLRVLSEMGHSDCVTIGDGNFPGESMGENAIVIHMEGHGVPEILDAILTLMPLDSYVKHPVTLMQVTPGDPVETPIWETYREIVAKHEPQLEDPIENMERFAFYDKVRSTYCVIQSSEAALYANIILQKGVIAPD